MASQLSSNDAAIAEAAGEALQAEAERLAAICEQSLAKVRRRQADATRPADAAIDSVV